MQVNLTVNAPGKAERTVPLRSDVVIGRGKTANLRIVSSDVSREHCRLSLQPDGVTLRDLGSANGTLLNGTEITAQTDVVIPPGGVIEIGPLKIAVEYESDDADTAVTSPASPGGSSEPLVATDAVSDSAVSDSAVPDSAAPDRDIPASGDGTSEDSVPPGDQSFADSSPAQESPSADEMSEAESEPPFDQPDIEPPPEFPESDLDEPVFDGLEEFDEAPADESVATFEVAPEGTGIQAEIDEPSIGETLADETPPAEERKLKSLFGLFRRGKKEEQETPQEPPTPETDESVEAATLTGPATTEAPADAVPEPSADPAHELAGAAVAEVESESPVEDALGDPALDSTEPEAVQAEMEAIDEPTLSEAPADYEFNPFDADASNDDDEPFDDEEIESEENVDEGFSDFLNQFGDDN